MKMILSLFTFAALLVAPAALAQVPEKTRTDAPSVRERWNSMSPEEQRRVLESYDRWKKLPVDEKSLMKRRFDKLETERRNVKESLDDDDRGALDRMRDHDRRNELTLRARDALRERFDRLPEDLRGRIEKDFRALPPPERAQRVKQSVKQHVEREMKERLGRKVESGELSRDVVEELRRKAADQEGDPRARLELLRKLLVDHPDAFHLTPEQVERVKTASDAGFALHLLDRLRHRGPPPPAREQLREDLPRRQRDETPRTRDELPRRRDEAPRDGGPRSQKSPKGAAPPRDI